MNLVRRLRRGSIRSRMLGALVLVLCVAAGVAAVGMRVMQHAERDFRDLAQDRIPAVALAGELAEATGDLAALTMRLVTDPAAPPGSIALGLHRAEKAVSAVLASPIWVASEGRAKTRSAIEKADGILRRELADFTRIRVQMERLAQAEAAADGVLRWAHADVQDEAQGLLSDLSFNMDARLVTLVTDNDVARRAAAEAALSQDRQWRDRLQRLAAEAATLTSVLLQARGAPTPAALEQAEALGRETLDAMALAGLNFPARGDVAHFLDAVTTLKELATGEEGVFVLAHQRLDLTHAAVETLGRAQAALGAMQAELTRFGAAERIHSQQRADQAAAAIRRGSLSLTLVTLLGLVVTAAIIAVFIHRRILSRVELLSDDLTRIARGDLTGGGAVGGRDEISDMARAVEVFRSSVRERQEAMAKLEFTQRELVQAGKMAALGEMSAAISHEINQPLAAIGHRLHNLVAANPEIRPAIARIEALLDRITRTIGHLRRIARRADHRATRVALEEPVSAALELLHPRLQAAGVEAQVSLPEGLIVRGDEILLEQVLLNVFGNAVDAIEATGRGNGRIAIQAEAMDPLIILIRDDGAGLGGQPGAALVDPFFTTKEPGRGLGLGLSISFNAMQDMGGHLEIEEAPGGGADVRLRLAHWREEDDG